MLCIVTYCYCVIVYECCVWFLCYIEASYSAHTHRQEVVNKVNAAQERRVDNMISRCVCVERQRERETERERERERDREGKHRRHTYKAYI